MSLQIHSLPHVILNNGVFLKCSFDTINHTISQVSNISSDNRKRIILCLMGTGVQHCTRLITTWQLKCVIGKKIVVNTAMPKFLVWHKYVLCWHNSTYVKIVHIYFCRRGNLYQCAPRRDLIISILVFKDFESQGQKDSVLIPTGRLFCLASWP